MYPETGPLRRELYAKHLTFFEGGAEHLERCMMAANRVGKCVTADTIIETSIGERAIGELWRRAQSFNVMAWDGTGTTQAEALPPFKKARVHDCYRVTMSDGRWFTGADLHRVLTSRGWRYLDELHQESASDLPASSLGRGLSVHGAGAQNWRRIAQGWLDHCFAGCRQCGERLRGVLGVGLVSAPSLADVPPHSVVWWPSGDRADRRTSIGQLASDRLSNPGAIRRFSALCAEFLRRTDSTTVEWLFGSCRGGVQLHLGSASQPRSYAGLGQCEDGIQRGPWSLPNVDGSIITSIDAVGRNEVYDFHVPRYENYVTRGVVHHNTWGVGAYETTAHLTGKYPDWWTGRRFDRPIDAWVAGDTSETTRDVIQVALTGVGGEGGEGDLGTGMVPGDLIVGKPSTKRGISGAFDTLRVKHVTGGVSKVGFKSYDQGRAKFQGTKKDLVWLDEEPPIDVYEESLLRLTGTTPEEGNGLMLCTFTPLNGLSKVALTFLPEMAPQ